MKFAVLKEHKDFFQNTGRIEFENLIASETLAKINRSIDETLAGRLNISPDRIPFTPSESLFLQGHDLWRSNPELRKFVMRPRFAEIAAELVEQKALRLGYDQLLPGRRHQTAPYENEQKFYDRFLAEESPLEKTDSFEGEAVAFLICLGKSEIGRETASEEKKEVPENDKKDIFPAEPGRAVFFKPSLSFDRGKLYLHKGKRFYLIVYTRLSAFYRPNPLDPHAHSLKHLGHLIDRPLADKLNPIIRR